MTMSEETRSFLRENRRLLQLGKDEHQAKFPGHSVSVDEMAAWCNQCQKGILPSCRMPEASSAPKS